MIKYAFSLSVILLFTANCQADETRQCNGIITSNGVCIGSESNVPPPIIDCTYNSSDPRCYRSRR